MGHIRDLPAKGLGVDVDHGFTPTYEVYAGKKDILRRLKAALKDADQLYLATDEDREGEAISWHLLEELKPTIPYKRMVFHEITPGAIRQAVDEGRDIDAGMVDAQESRRIVDRLFGYPVSSVLWRKVNQGLSAGRVQSPAVRLVVERERERIAFVSADYWDLSAAFATDPRFSAGLSKVGGDKVAQGRDFDPSGRLSRDGVVVLDEARAGALRTRSGRRHLHRHQRRREALHVPPQAAVHDLHPPAGGRPQAPHVVGPGHAGGPGALPGWLHHLHADRLHQPVGDRAPRRPQPDRVALRPRVRARRPPPLRQEGQGRPGGPRGHPAGGGDLPHPRVAPRPAPGRFAGPLRPGVEAHRGQPDGRCPGPQPVGPPRRRRGRARRRRAHAHRVVGLGAHHHLPRLHAGLRRGGRRPRRPARRPGEPAPAPDRGPDPHRRRDRGPRPHDLPAGRATPRPRW